MATVSHAATEACILLLLFRPQGGCPSSKRPSSSHSSAERPAVPTVAPPAQLRDSRESQYKTCSRLWRAMEAGVQAGLSGGIPIRLLSGSDYVGRGYHHRGAHLDSSSELSCCGGKWQNILAIFRPNMMQWSPGRPRAHDVGVVRQQHGSNDPGSGARSSEDCPWKSSLEFSLRRFSR